MTLIEELLVSPLFLLSVVVFVALIGWLFIVKIFVPGDNFWRISNFIVLTITCLGILGVVQDGRSFLNFREYNQIQRCIESDYKWRLLSKLKEDSYRIEFVKTEYSPNNLDDMQHDYNTIYQWIGKNKQYIYNCYNNKEYINIDSICYPSLRASDQIIESYFKNIDHCIADYNNDITELREYEKGQLYNDFGLFYILLSPLFIAVGLGWEFVKFFAKR